MNKASVLIKEICKNDFFHNNIYLMAGRQGLSNKVSHVSVMEVEDFVSFDLGVNLLVLTTFSFCQSDEKKMLSIVKKLSQKKVSGLIVKLNRYIQNIPSEIIDFGNKNQLPIFIIDNDIPFRSIINHVYELIIHKQYETIFQMNNMYKSLYSSLITDVTVDQYIQQLGISPDLNFYVESQEAIIYNSPSLLMLDDPSVYDYDETDGHNISKKIYFEGFEEVTYKNEKMLVFPIRTATIKFGNIVLFSNYDKLSTVERMAFTQLASYLSIKLNELRMNQKERLSNNGRIYNELIDGHTLSRTKAENLLHSAGLATFANYCIVFISIIDPELSYEKIERVKNKYASIFYDESSKYFMGYTAGGFRIVYGLDYRSDGKDPLFNNFIREIQEIFKVENIPFKIGISKPFDELEVIPLAHYQAKNTVLISRRVPGYNQAIFYKDIWEIDMITALVNSSQVKDLRDNIIQPLLEHDKCHQVKLLDTLEAIVLKESLKEVSEDFFIHITTLRYRLDKIKVLTGYDYQINRGRFVLTMAYFAYILDLI